MKIIGIIEDHPIVAHGIKNMVHLFWNGSTVQTFATFPKEDQDLLLLAQCSIIIADIHLKEENILDDLHLQQIQKPSLKIILYTSSHPWELGLSKHEFPFWGYVQKNADLQAITACLSAVERNQKYLQDELEWEKMNLDESSSIVLTKRELEILQHIKAGKTSKEIGEILFLSELTIKSHRQNMMRKFEVKNVVELLDRTKNWL